jgi:hypothetical protein
MAKLILSLNGAIQGEYQLNKERMTIGRKPDNDIQIDDLEVSGEHALITTTLDDSFLEDLGSTNGTYVNGKLIKKHEKHALRNGDVVGLGKHEIKYHVTADEDFEKTISTDHERKSETAAGQWEHQEGQLEDDGRGWCGVRTYITGPQAIKPGESGEFKSNYYIDLDPGCKSGHIDEVLWTLTNVALGYQGLIHIQQQDVNGCVVAVETGVPSGTQFTLHATPAAHALGKGMHARTACQVTKSDAQVISVA